jgi:hypothetical protein
VPAKKAAAKPARTPGPPKHEFLSPEWIAAVEAVRDEFRDKVQPPSISVRANVVVTDAPFGDGVVNGSIDTSEGQLALEAGHVDTPDLTITTDYATAKQLFVMQDQQAAMQAIFGGKIKITGDMSSLLAMQLPLNEPSTAEIARTIAERIKAFTAD